MNRFRSVARLWNWLPVFRIVAEHESIHKASSILATSPSALSRTVKLLEEALDVPLFERRDAKLVLTPAGERLLSATRNAMRLIDDGLPTPNEDAKGDNRVPMRLQVGTTSRFTAMLMELVIAVRRDVREVADLVVIETPGSDTSTDGVQALLRGDLDILVTHHTALFPVPSSSSSDLLVERMGSMRFGVYVGPTHTLAANASANANANANEAESENESLSEIFPEPFVSLRGGDDGWPVERSRHVAISTSTLDGLLAYCMTGELVACLSDVVTTRLGLARTLRRVADAGPPHVLFSIRRKPLPAQDTVPIDVVLHAVRAALNDF